MVKRSKHSCGFKNHIKQTEVRKEGGRLPFHPLATTLVLTVHVHMKNRNILLQVTLQFYVYNVYVASDLDQHSKSYIVVLWSM